MLFQFNISGAYQKIISTGNRCKNVCYDVVMLVVIMRSSGAYRGKTQV